MANKHKKGGIPQINSEIISISFIPCFNKKNIYIHE